VRHLARHFGVAAFVGVEEAVAVQVPAQRDRREQDEESQAGNRARWRRRRGLNKLGVWVIDLGR
jgi:hypothetical protein